MDDVKLCSECRFSVSGPQLERECCYFPRDIGLVRLRDARRACRGAFWKPVGESAPAAEPEPEEGGGLKLWAPPQTDQGEMTRRDQFALAAMVTLLRTSPRPPAAIAEQAYAVADAMELAARDLLMKAEEARAAMVRGIAEAISEIKEAAGFGVGDFVELVKPHREAQGASILVTPAETLGIVLAHSHPDESVRVRTAGHGPLNIPPSNLRLLSRKEAQSRGASTLLRRGDEVEWTMNDDIGGGARGVIVSFSPNIEAASVQLHGVDDLARIRTDHLRLVREAPPAPEATFRVGQRVELLADLEYHGVARGSQGIVEHIVGSRTRFHVRFREGPVLSIKAEQLKAVEP